jgi:GNAT superfamily N-acetyltransferase
VQIELAHLADPAIGALLTERGYRLVSFENVLGLALEGEPKRVDPPGVEVRPSGDDELEAWIDVVAEGVAQLTGAATAPAHRRRGVHGALLWARLADAAAAGCDIAVVTTQPASKSQQNVQRRGFDLLYTRAVLVKQPALKA